MSEVSTPTLSSEEPSSDESRGIASSEPPSVASWKSWLTSVRVWRVLAAWTIMLSVLPYAWGRCLIFTMLRGYPETYFVGITAAAIIGVIALTWRLGEKPPWTARIARRWIAVVAISWIIANMSLAWLSMSSSVQKELFGPMFTVAGLWVVWLGWMFFAPIAWTRRIAVLAILLLLTAGFASVAHVPDLDGDAKINVRWRSAPKDLLVRARNTTSVADTPYLAPEGKTAVDLSKTTPHDYSEFMGGPRRDAVVTDVKLSKDWKTEVPKKLWRHPVGGGWGSFAAVGPYALTQEQRGSEETVVCYEVCSGKPLWVHADQADLEGSAGGPGPRATPTVVDGEVYTLGATGILNRLNGADGKLVWTANILKDNDNAGNLPHGMCSSPLVVGNLVYVCPSGAEDKSLAAYDRATGKRVFCHGAGPAGYSSPQIDKVAGVEQILVFNSVALAGHDPKSGEVLWSFPWENGTHTNCSQPVVLRNAPNRIFLSTAYDKGAVLLELSKPTTGDKLDVKELWKSRFIKTKFTTAVEYKDHIYGLDDGILACIDLAKGRKKWKDGRYGHGQIMLVGDLILVLAENGDVVLVEPDAKGLKELGKFSAIEGKTWNNPALSGNILLVRNNEEAAAYELPLAK